MRGFGTVAAMRAEEFPEHRGDHGIRIDLPIDPHDQLMHAVAARPAETEIREQDRRNADRWNSQPSDPVETEPDRHTHGDGEDHVSGVARVVDPRAEADDRERPDQRERASGVAADDLRDKRENDGQHHEGDAEAGA